MCKDHNANVRKVERLKPNSFCSATKY